MAEEVEGLADAGAGYTTARARPADCVSLAAMGLVKLWDALQNLVDGSTVAGLASIDARLIYLAAKGESPDLAAVVIWRANTLAGDVVRINARALVGGAGHEVVDTSAIEAPACAVDNVILIDVHAILAVIVRREAHWCIQSHAHVVRALASTEARVVGCLTRLSEI